MLEVLKRSSQKCVSDFAMKFCCIKIWLLIPVSRQNFVSWISVVNSRLKFCSNSIWPNFPGPDVRTGPQSNGESARPLRGKEFGLQMMLSQFTDRAAVSWRHPVSSTVAQTGVSERFTTWLDPKQVRKPVKIHSTAKPITFRAIDFETVWKLTEIHSTVQKSLLCEAFPARLDPERARKPTKTGTYEVQAITDRPISILKLKSKF